MLIIIVQNQKNCLTTNIFMIAPIQNLYLKTFTVQLSAKFQSYFIVSLEKCYTIFSEICECLTNSKTIVSK